MLVDFIAKTDGLLELADFEEPTTRAQLFEVFSDSALASPTELVGAMRACPPLAWEVHRLYDALRTELVMEHASEKPERRRKSPRAVALERRLLNLPEEPEDGAGDWVLGLTTTEFQAIVTPRIEAWFKSEPDWMSEGEYIAERATAQGAALDYLQSLDQEILDQLGIRIVEGRHPGCSYFAAELYRSIDEANSAAYRLGQPLRFLRHRRAKPSSALSELLALDLEQRRQAVADDLFAKSPRYEAIEAHDLAEALGISAAERPDGNWNFMCYAKPETAEQYASRWSDLRSEIVYLIEDQVSPRRFKQLLRLSESLDDMDVPDFSFLKPKERDLLEAVILKERLRDNLESTFNVLAHITVIAPGGEHLRFEADIEDDGACINLRTPYDERAGRFVNCTVCLTEHW
jgi:hypothetical protein